MLIICGDRTIPEFCTCRRAEFGLNSATVPSLHTRQVNWCIHVWILHRRASLLQQVWTNTHNSLRTWWTSLSPQQCFWKAILFELNEFTLIGRRIWILLCRAEVWRNLIVGWVFKISVSASQEGVPFLRTSFRLRNVKKMRAKLVRLTSRVQRREKKVWINVFWATRVSRKWTFWTLEPWLWTIFWENRVYKSKDTWQ